MSAPRLNRRFRLESPVALADGAGGQIAGWEECGTLWGAVAGAPHRESPAPGAMIDQTHLRITLRAAPPGAPSRPVPGQRLRDGSRWFTVLSVTESGPDARYLTCLVREERAR